MPKQTFESAMKKLEQIVVELETGELPLEKGMKKFEQGIRLSELCAEKLNETEKQVKILLQDSQGNVLERPFVSNVIGQEISDLKETND